MLLIVSRLNHICSILLVAFLVISSTSCTRWSEAKGVIAEADRLLEYGEIIEDTALLAATINTFNGPLGYVFARNDLSKAYYHMARNFYHAHDYATAADYYILCDRLKPSDPMYKGRVNSCMGFLCKQDSCFAEALEFYEHSSRAFKESGNNWYFAHNLLNVAEQYVSMEEYQKADSILHIASGYEIDSAYYASIVDIKALALYNQQKYDSALVCLLSIEDYQRHIEAKCYSYKLIMRCYYDTGKVNLAIPYAEYIIQKSTNLNYRSSAYCVLLDSVVLNTDFNTLASYSNDREEIDRILQHLSKSYAQAADKLNNYLLNPNPSIGWIILLGCVLLVSIYLLVLNKKHVKRSKLATNELYLQIQNMESERQTIMDNNLQVVREKVFNNSVAFPLDSDIWKDVDKLFEKVNNLYNNLFAHLQKDFGLKEQELKLVLLVLLDVSNNTIADMLGYSYKSVGAIKRYVAKKLGTQARHLKEFLIKYIASKSIIS